MAEWLKWWQTIKINLSKYMAYKTNFALMVLGPGLVFYFVKVNLWRSVYQEGTTIGGYDADAMIAYQSWALIVSFLATGFQSINLSEEIRLGRISAYLIYPFSFFRFHCASFIAFQWLQCGIATVTLGILNATGALSLPSWDILLTGVLLAWLVGLLWFALSYLIGIMAFWLDETWTLRVMFSTIAVFLSGHTIPIELFPDWLSSSLELSPFPYMVWLPVRVLMGLPHGDLLQAVAILVAWLLFFLAMGHLVFSRGIRHYTAAGM